MGWGIGRSFTYSGGTMGDDASPSDGKMQLPGGEAFAESVAVVLLFSVVWLLTAVTGAVPSRWGSGHEFESNWHSSSRSHTGWLWAVQSEGAHCMACLSRVSKSFDRGMRSPRAASLRLYTSKRFWTGRVGPRVSACPL